MNAEQEALVLSVRPLALFIAGRMRAQPPLEREDLAQAGLAELCRKIDCWEERGAFAAWAGTVMGNAMRRENQSMTWRRQSRHPVSRPLHTTGSVQLLLDYGHAVPIVGASGLYDQRRGIRRPVRAPKPLAG